MCWLLSHTRVDGKRIGKPQFLRPQRGKTGSHINLCHICIDAVNPFKNDILEVHTVIGVKKDLRKYVPLSIIKSVMLIMKNIYQKAMKPCWIENNSLLIIWLKMLITTLVTLFSYFRLFFTFFKPVFALACEKHF